MSSGHRCGPGGPAGGGGDELQVLLRHRESRMASHLCLGKTAPQSFAPFMYMLGEQLQGLEEQFQGRGHVSQVVRHLSGLAHFIDLLGEQFQGVGRVSQVVRHLSGLAHFTYLLGEQFQGLGHVSQVVRH